MDLTVPGAMGGIEAVARLRAVDPEVRAIVSSGYCNDPAMGEFERYGFSGVLAKPYTTAQNVYGPRLGPSGRRLRRYERETCVIGRLRSIRRRSNEHLATPNPVLIRHFYNYRTETIIQRTGWGKTQPIQAP